MRWRILVLMAFLIRSATWLLLRLSRALRVPGAATLPNS